AQRGLNQKAGFVGDQRALDLNLDYLAPDGEPPRRECAAWKAQADAIVRVQVLRFCWPGMPRQVVRRSNDDNAQVVRHAHRDHVARNAVTEANSSVVSADDDVGQRGIGGDREDDLRVLRNEKRASRGASTKEATGGGTVMRSCPAGRSRNALTESTAASNSSNKGRKRLSMRSPASVGATLRAVRLSRR